MYEFSDLRQMPEKELLAEFDVVHEYADRLIGLATMLGQVHTGCTGLAAIYRGQKGHEVFLMALDVVEHACAARAEVVTQRLAATVRYVDNIIEFLGYVPEGASEWAAFETLLTEEELPLFLKGEKEEDQKR